MTKFLFLGKQIYGHILMVLQLILTSQVIPTVECAERI